MSEDIFKKVEIFAKRLNKKRQIKIFLQNQTERSQSPNDQPISFRQSISAKQSPTFNENSQRSIKTNTFELKSLQLFPTYIQIYSKFY